ncbi:MAG TPA: transcriptional repressor, partial [Candidatus Obscuribacterales bacterium]
MNRDPCLKPSAPPTAMHPDRRLTRSQDAVLAVLQEQRSPLSAQALYRLMRDRQSIGLATVYRALDSLKLKGLVQHRVSLEGELLYSSMHHDLHYLTCLHCGQSF